MSNTSKIAIGISLASGAMVAAWLLTGDKGKRTTKYIVKKASKIKRRKRSLPIFDDSEVHYI